MPDKRNVDTCLGCIWSDICAYAGPCSHYTPGGYEEMLLDIDIQRERERYDEEWHEYMEYCEEEYN